LDEKKNIQVFIDKSLFIESFSFENVKVGSLLDLKELIKEILILRNVDKKLISYLSEYTKENF